MNNNNSNSNNSKNSNNNSGNIIQNPVFDAFATQLCTTRINLKLGNNNNSSNSNNRDVAADAFACVTTDDAIIKPWTVTSANKTFQISSGLWPLSTALRSSWSIDLNGGAPNRAAYTIGQILETVPGTDYTITYYVLNPQCDADSTAASPKTGFIRIRQLGNNSNSSLLGVSFAPSDKWKPRIYQFTAKEHSILFEIGSTTKNSSCGPLVGGVFMNPVNNSTKSDDNDTSLVTLTPSDETIQKSSSQPSVDPKIIVIAVCVSVAVVVMIIVALLFYKRNKSSSATTVPWMSLFSFGKQKDAMHSRFSQDSLDNIFRKSSIYVSSSDSSVNSSSSSISSSSVRSESSGSSPS